MIKVRFATEEDAKSISNLCSKAWKLIYADILTAISRSLRQRME